MISKVRVARRSLENLVGSSRAEIQRSLISHVGDDFSTTMACDVFASFHMVWSACSILFLCLEGEAFRDSHHSVRL